MLARTDGQTDVLTGYTLGAIPLIFLGFLNPPMTEWTETNPTNLTPQWRNEKTETNPTNLTPNDGMNRNQPH